MCVCVCVCVWVWVRWLRANADNGFNGRARAHTHTHTPERMRIKDSMGNVLEPLLCKLALNHIDDDDLTIRMCLLTSRPFTILRTSSYVPSRMCLVSSTPIHYPLMMLQVNRHSESRLTKRISFHVVCLYGRHASIWLPLHSYGWFN